MGRTGYMHGVTRNAGAAVGLAVGFVATLAGAQEPARRQPVVPNGWFDSLVDDTIAVTRRNMKVVRASAEERASARRKHRFGGVALRTPVLDRATAGSAVELASAALKASIEGAEAGVSVAPAGFLGGGDAPVQPSLGVAALENGVTRYLFAANYQSPWRPEFPPDIGLPACTVSEKSERKFREQADDVRYAHEHVCQAILPLAAGKDTASGAAAKDAVTACKGPRHADHPLTLEAAFANIDAFVKKKRKEQQAKSPTEWLEFEELMSPSSGDLKALRDFREPVIDCYKKDQIKQALAQASWSAVRYRAGIAYSSDLFELDFGFNPKPSTGLSKGQPARNEIRADLARVSGAFEVHAGLGFGRSHEAFADPFVTYLAPSLSLACTVASLSADPLYVDGKLNTLDGAPPPRLVLGLDGDFQYSFNPPATQITKFSRVTATVYADFIVTEKLGFRLGVPVRAKLVKRDADEKAKFSPPIPEEKNLQWSVPVFAATILKM